MADAQTQKKSKIEIVMPDYSNTGVAFRVLLAVNGTVFSVCVIQARGMAAGVLNFIDAAVLVELACLSSIFVLFFIRRALQYSGVLSVMSAWAQRFICVLVPATLTGLIVRYLQPYDWFSAGGNLLTAREGVAMGALFGIVLQHYFELRARAFSPALAEARLQALQARIHPHFLFNSLNAVLSLIRKEPRKAETALEDLAELFRVSMRDAREMTRLNEEIRLCKQYLSLEEIRLGERLQVQWDMEDITDEELYTAQIATLMLQPLLENAINYGVEPVQHPALVEVKVSCSLGSVEILVKNPVPPTANTAMQVLGGNRMALGNIRERLMLLYDVEAELSSETIDGKFVVRLRFPYRWGLE
ncbi:MAG: histidine kinase [Oxalobacter sp.]|nr:MAG: histidine kinase [Oxalobacter sp.]